MRKNLSVLFFLFCLVMFFPLTTEVSANDGNTVDDIYQKSIRLGLLNIDNNTVTFNGQLEDLTTNPDLQIEFQNKLDAINFLLEKDLATIDNNFKVTLPTPSEVAEIVYNSDNTSENNTYSFSPFAMQPTIILFDLVSRNRAEIENIFYTTLRVNPSGAHGFTTGYFVGKVQPGGAWDYKIQPGFQPWYKEFVAYTYSGRKIVTSEYIGNYNYGYVGQFLFSKTTLLMGGGVVGSGVGSPEDAKDKMAITNGFDDAVRNE